MKKTAISFSALALTALLAAPAAFAGDDYYSTGGGDYHNGGSDPVDMYDSSKYDIPNDPVHGNRQIATIDTLTKNTADMFVGANTLNNGQTFSLAEFDRTGVVFGNITSDGAVDWQVSTLVTQRQAAGALDQGPTSAALISVDAKQATWDGVLVEFGSD